MAIGNNIKTVLDMRGKTIKWLADTIGIPKNTLYSFIQRDSNRIQPEIREKIADALEMQLLLKNTSDGKEYIIDYPEEQKGKPKRGRKSEE